MLHVNVRTNRHSDGVRDIVVEVSNDGAPWKRLATFPQTDGVFDFEMREANARQFAGAWTDGARYAGAEVRATAFGYTL